MTRSAPQPEPAAYRLKVRIDGREFSAVVAAQPIRIGSDASCDVTFVEPTVSRAHARVRALPDGLEVEDLASRNGTRVRGTRIQSPTLVKPGDALRFGELVVAVEPLEAGDARAGVRPAAEAPHAEDESQAPMLRPTLGSAGITSFCLRELDPLLRALAAVDSLPTFAAGVLDALARAEPGAGFVLRRTGSDAMLAMSGASNEGMPASTLERDDLRLVMTARDADALVPLQSLARLGLGLLATAARHLQRTDAIHAGAASGEDAAAASAKGSAAEPPPPPIASGHSGLRETYWQAARVARSRLNVLVTGPSGTGKELLARYLHEASDEPPDAFLVLNCAALPGDLLDAELFGIERGIATGVTARPGRFELAHGGTLFLDEIGDMALDTQARILRVLQERVVYRVGSHKPRPADVRVVSATNRDLEAMVAEGNFRLDLYHRIADWRARVPPLAERRMDIANLAMQFLEQAAAKRGVRPEGISESALRHLLAYDWPGNVRELEREMQRVALFLEPGDLVVSTQLKPEILASGGDTADDEGDRTLAAQLAREERRVIARALAEHDGQVSEAAKSLGMGRATLYRRIGQLGLGDESA